MIDKPERRHFPPLWMVEETDRKLELQSFDPSPRSTAPEVTSVREDVGIFAVAAVSGAAGRSFHGLNR